MLACPNGLFLMTQEQRADERRLPARADRHRVPAFDLKRSENPELELILHHPGR